MGIHINSREPADIQREKIIEALNKKQRFPWLPTIVIGIIICLFNYFLDDIRDWRSIKQNDTREGNKTITNVTVKTTGPLMLGDRPIYIYNEGTINKIEVAENQKDLVVVTPIGSSAAIILQKIPVEGHLSFRIEASGDSTVSASPSIVKFR